MQTLLEIYTVMKNQPLNFFKPGTSGHSSFLSIIPSPSMSGGVLVPLPHPTSVANKSAISIFEKIELEIMISPFSPFESELLNSLNA